MLHTYTYVCMYVHGGTFLLDFLATSYTLLTLYVKSNCQQRALIRNIDLELPAEYQCYAFSAYYFGLWAHCGSFLISYLLVNVLWNLPPRACPTATSSHEISVYQNNDLKFSLQL